MAQYSLPDFQFVFCIFSVIFVTHLGFFCSSEDVDSQAELNDNPDHGREKLPTVFIPLLARNKAHSLPTFLAYLENLNYPKDRITLWYVVFPYLFEHNIVWFTRERLSSSESKA